MKTTTIRLPSDVYQALRELSFKNDMTVSSTIRKIICDWFEDTPRSLRHEFSDESLSEEEFFNE